MPEGPTIRRIADCMREHLSGQTLRAVELGVANQRQHEAALRGAQLLDVRAFGKAIVFDVEGGWSIFTHTQLFGRWFVVKPGQEAPGKKKLGLALETSEHKAVLTSTTKIEVLRTQDLKRHSFLGKLGPDTLDPEVTQAQVMRQLDAFGKQPLGTILLDQSFMAGIGNYLRAEILFLAGLRPEHLPERLDAGQRERLAHQILATPRRAYQAQGFTTSDEHIARGEARGVPRAQLRRYVYEHAGEPCPTCSTTLVEEQFDGRRIFICPRCQR